MQGDRVNKWMLFYSDNVEKELKYDHYIFTSSTDSHAPHSKQQRCSEKTGIQSLEILGRQSWWRHCKVSSVHVQPNQRFSLGHQGLPRLHQSLEKPLASTKQERYGEDGGVGGGEEVQGAPRSEERCLSNCCLMSCPKWTSWNGGSITRPSSPSCQVRQEGLPSASYFI